MVFRNNFRGTNIYVIVISRERGMERTENIFEEIMDKIFQIAEDYRPTGSRRWEPQVQKYEQHHSTALHNQLLKSSDNKKILKAARGKNTY